MFHSCLPNGDSVLPRTELQLLKSEILLERWGLQKKPRPVRSVPFIRHVLPFFLRICALHLATGSRVTGPFSCFASRVLRSELSPPQKPPSQRGVCLLGAPISSSHHRVSLQGMHSDNSAVRPSPVTFWTSLPQWCVHPCFLEQIELWEHLSFSCANPG